MVYPIPKVSAEAKSFREGHLTNFALASLEWWKN